MNRQETATLLAAVQAFDNRNVEAIHVEAWHAILERYKIEDCRAAVVAHYAVKRDWLMPADIVQYVRRQDPHQAHLEQW